MSSNVQLCSAVSVPYQELHTVVKEYDQFRILTKNILKQAIFTGWKTASASE